MVNWKTILITTVTILFIILVFFVGGIINSELLQGIVNFVVDIITNKLLWVIVIIAIIVFVFVMIKRLKGGKKWKKILEIVVIVAICIILFFILIFPEYLSYSKIRQNNNYRKCLQLQYQSVILTKEYNSKNIECNNIQDEGEKNKCKQKLEELRTRKEEVEKSINKICTEFNDLRQITEDAVKNWWTKTKFFIRVTTPYYVLNFLGFNKEGIWDLPFWEDLLLGLTAGLWIWIVNKMISIVHYLTKIEKDKINKYEGSWLYIIGGQLWKVIIIGMTYAVLMQLPFVSTFLNIITFRTLMPDSRFIISFIIAFEIGFGPTAIQEFIRYKIRMRYYKVLIETKYGAKIMRGIGGRS